MADPTKQIQQGQDPKRRTKIVQTGDMPNIKRTRAPAPSALSAQQQFPRGTTNLPPELIREEQRRSRIRQEIHKKRVQIMSKASTEERIRLEELFKKEDRRYYLSEPGDRAVETYAVKPPFQYVQIIRNDLNHQSKYHAIEPMLSVEEAELVKFIEKTLVDVLSIQVEELDERDLDTYIREQAESVISDYNINLKKLVTPGETLEQVKNRIMYYMLRDFIGEGPLDVLMNDVGIEDVSVDGPHVPVFVYHRKHEALTTTIYFESEPILDNFVVRLAQRSGKHISVADPILDATMRDGSRLQATLAREVSAYGSTFTIRKFREVPFTPIDLAMFGTLDPKMLAYLWLVIEGKMSGMFAGGTASGKTTGLNALMMFIPDGNKVITIEDTREVRVPQPNWIAGITRSGFGPKDSSGRQAGEIDMFQLLKNALRQRPEYIIVGEVRGAEAYSLFQAMATGHAAYGTMHADSVDAVIRRLESEPISIPRSMLEALDVVCIQIQTRVGGKRVRRTKNITEIVGIDPHTREILTNDVFSWDPGSDTFIYRGVSYALDRLAAERGTESSDMQKELEKRTMLLTYMRDKKITDYGQVEAMIRQYLNDPASIGKLIRG